MHQVNIFEAKTNLSKFIERALKGEEIIIARAGKPLVRLQPLEKKKEKKKIEFGFMKGKMWVAPDWDSDETNKEIERLMYGEDDDQDPLTSR